MKGKKVMVDHDLRVFQVKATVTKSEKDKMETAASAAGLSVSNWLRALAQHELDRVQDGGEPSVGRMR